MGFLSHRRLPWVGRISWVDTRRTDRVVLNLAFDQAPSRQISVVLSVEEVVDLEDRLRLWRYGRPLN